MRYKNRKKQTLSKVYFLEDFGMNTVLQLLTSEGSSGFAEGLRLLVDEAMVQERCAPLKGSGINY